MTKEEDTGNKMTDLRMAVEKALDWYSGIKLFHENEEPHIKTAIKVFKSVLDGSIYASEEEIFCILDTPLNEALFYLGHIGSTLNNTDKEVIKKRLAHALANRVGKVDMKYTEDKIFDILFNKIRIQKPLRAAGAIANGEGNEEKIVRNMAKEIASKIKEE